MNGVARKALPGADRHRLSWHALDGATTWHRGVCNSIALGMRGRRPQDCVARDSTFGDLLTEPQVQERC
jgi:hypothetical protein